MSPLLLLIPGSILIITFFLISKKINQNKAAKDISNYWNELLSLMEKRHDILPYLLETLKEVAPQEEKLFQETVKRRSEAYFINPLPASCGPAEEKLNKALITILNFGKNDVHLKKDPRFLEIKKEILDLSLAIKAVAKKYNQAVRTLASSGTKISLGIFPYLNC